MVIVFIVLSAGAVIAAVRQARPELPMPLAQLILVNEMLALIVTLIYGILTHLVFTLIDRIRNDKKTLK